jgi:hypothetical protein
MALEAMLLARVNDLRVRAGVAMSFPIKYINIIFIEIAETDDRQ